MDQFKFDTSYNQYWKDRVKHASDGTKVPGLEVIEELVAELKISSKDKVLDLGCGQGRIFPVIKHYTNIIFGIDIDLSMINDATLYDYTSLHVATAEDSRYPDNYFDKIIMLGTFDVVEQEKSLAEINRILKIGGTCLITGKNDTYCKDDEKAFIAERNAKLKNFPNRFTDVKKIIENLSVLGYSCEKLNVFIRRGDFGDNKKVEVVEDWVPEFYEYCIILKKICNASQTDIRFASEFSKTVKDMAKEQKEDNILAFFNANKNHLFVNRNLANDA